MNSNNVFPKNDAGILSYFWSYDGDDDEAILAIVRSLTETKATDKEIQNFFKEKHKEAVLASGRHHSYQESEIAAIATFRYYDESP